MTPAFITLNEAAERLRIGPQALRRRISRGELRAYRVQGSRLIRLAVADVDALLVPIPTAR